jgi:ubiquinone/menaquinone biosynthesis C-methylase UbiE
MRGIEQIPWAYDLFFTVQEALGLSRWRKWLVSGARGRTLDLGCGTGRNLPLYGSGVQVVGLDPYLPSLLVARKRRPDVPLVRGSAEALPFKPGTFDTVVSGLVFCSIPNVPQALGEVRRVLAPDGELRMLEHVRAKGRLHARLQDGVQPAWTCLTGGCHPNRDTEAAVASGGFRIEPESRHEKGIFRRFAARPGVRG